MKPTVPDVLPAVKALYARDRAGCCLHVVLDDGNVDDASVRFCIDYAHERQHEECAKLAETLLSMSRTQRGRLAHPHSRST